MADAIVSLVLDQLASILYEQIQAKVTLVAGVDEEVRTLTSNFRAIQAVLVDAENRQVKEESVRDWLEKLQHASYDIDNVLDEWNTEIQKLRMKKLENASSKKVCSLIRSCCFSPFLRHDIASKIKNLNKTLDEIAKEKERYNFRPMSGTKELVRAMTTSFSNEPKIYGREQDTHRIRNFLFQERSQGPNIPIISIIGIGGLGKTALVRQVFNDDEVQSYFDEKLWVCVSDPFDEVRIAKAILTSLKRDVTKLLELQDLLQDIQHSIKGKKFLLVLDDVWTEDFKNWEQLMGSFKSASQESRILVTTRNERTAETINTNEKIFPGKLSKEECWSLLSQLAFSGVVIEDERFEDIGRKIVDKCDGLPLAVKSLGSLLRLKKEIRQWQNVLDDKIWNLENIEEQVFRPLLLSYFDLPSKLKKCFTYCAIFPKDYEIEKYELIRLWMAQGYLKVDYSKNSELIGEEYFQNLAMRSFFQDFRTYRIDRIERSYCKMHDMVHDVAQFLTKNECSFIENDAGANPQLEFSYENAQHLMIKGKSIPSPIYNGKKLRSFVVESSHDLKSGGDLSELFERLTFLRVLSLSCYNSIKEVPRKIENLIHLRYLNLSRWINLKELPETFCELCNLETLDLGYCHALQKLPKRIEKLIHLKYINLTCCFELKEFPKTFCKLSNLETLNVYNHMDVRRRGSLQKPPEELGNLINLRHLIIYDDWSYMPKGIQRLTCLLTLPELRISDDGNGKEEACRIECLKNLNDLQGSLKLKGLGHVRNAGEVEKAELKNKKNVTDLCLRFDGRELFEDDGILEAFEPPRNLEILSIECYNGNSNSMFPSWMISLTSLKELKLYRCSNFKCLPPLGKLSSLESLILCHILKLKRVGNEFLGIENDTTSSSSSIIAFPKLKRLEILWMDDLEEWNYEITSENITIMPCLYFLSINRCKKLQALPDHLLRSTTLKELEIEYCPLPNFDKLRIFLYRGNTIFPNLTKLTLHGAENCYLPLGKLPFLESLHFCFMESVKRVDNEFLGIERSGTSVVAFPKLKTLEFGNMGEWEEWDIQNGDEDIEIMPCLHFLSIFNCNKLQALPEHILQKPTLKKLNIYNYISDCSILIDRYNKETGGDWSKISHIPETNIK